MYFGFRLALRRRRDGRLELAVPLPWRLLLLAIGGLVLLALLATTSAPLSVRNVVPLLFALLALLGAAYEERWVFDRPRDLLLRRQGLWPVRQSRRLVLSQLKQVGLERLVRGRPADSPARGRRRTLVILQLVDGEGRVYRLEQYSAALHSRAREAGLAIASYCGLPFRDEAGEA